MDFFTHLLVGIVIGRLLFNDPNKQKAIALGSILPDFDIIFAWIPYIFPQLYLLSHRGLFHSIITLLLVFPLAVIVLNKITSFQKMLVFQKELTIEITFYSYITGILGTYLHLFMDLLNPQGVVLFSPLSSQRYTFSTMNFIEPAVSIPSAIIVLFYGFIKYYKKQEIDFKRFDIYSRAVSITFVGFILLNSFLMVQTISTQQSLTSSPGYLLTERWVVVDHNSTYDVKLIDQLNQQTIKEFSFDKITYNATEISLQLKNQLIDNAKKTIQYTKYEFTIDPDTRTVASITKDLESNQWIITFKDVISEAQQLYYNLPQNSFFQHSTVIKISTN